MQLFEILFSYTIFKQFFNKQTLKIKWIMPVEEEVLSWPPFNEKHSIQSFTFWNPWWWHPAVNFINIIRTNFSYELPFLAAFLVTFWLWHQNSHKKRARKSWWNRHLATTIWDRASSRFHPGNKKVIWTSVSQPKGRGRFQKGRGKFLIGCGLCFSCFG